MESTPERSHFLQKIIAADVKAGRYGGRVVTRFPPEPNGYPHLGHAQSICLNFGLAEQFGGVTNLRYDDTNPEGESLEFAEALEDAVRWLGFTPNEIRFASDYFEQFYAWAVDLVERGLAYVDSQSEEEIRTNRGTVTEPGTPSPYRDRSPEENLRLLEEMRRGEHPDGSHVLRAKIDMADPNMKLRDPLMYRIRRDAHHYRRGEDWKIYPLYDWAHGQGDAIEGITHSICTLEFDVNRPLYDWFMDAIGFPEPRNHQYEFARFNLDYTVMSKRKLRRLVEEGHVRGWDDPRMPTLAAQRRRGVRPEAIRTFFDEIGVTNVNGSVDLARYEYALRDDLNAVAPRVLAVTDPLKLTITNLPEPVEIDAPYWPHDVTPPSDAPRSRPLRLGPELWIEREDFAEEPPKGWKRLSPGASVRLRHGYVITCTDVEKDEDGTVTALRAEAVIDSFDPATGEGTNPADRKVGGVIHWADAATALPARFRIYDRLFREPAPDTFEDFTDALNPDSLVVRDGYVEPTVTGDPRDTRYQFERLGYFWRDPNDSTPDAPVFNRIVALKDAWTRHTLKAKGLVGKSTLGKASIKPQQPVGPRDPAEGLTTEQRASYDTLVARGAGEEEAAVLAAEPDLSALFDATVEAGASAREAAVLLVHDLRPALGDRSLDESAATPAALADVIRLVGQQTITKTAAGDVIVALVNEGGDAEAVVDVLGLAAVRDDAALAPAVDAVIAEHADEVERYRSGEKRLIGFFMGQTMRRAGKSADAQVVRTLLQERLEG